METNDRLERWVRGRMTASAPPAGWPDGAAGWRRLDHRIARRPVPLFVWAGATATLCAALFALPGPRAAAQRFFDRVIVGRIQVLVLDFERSGAAAGVFTPEIDQHADATPVASFGDATRLAGFAPRLPGSDIFQGSPAYSVADVTVARLRLRTPAIRDLVERAGGSASEVPDAWNGATLEVRIGPVIIADYDGILLLQSPPFELVTPAGFDLQLFYRLALRAVGMSEPDAWALSGDLGISPALLMFMPKEDAGLVHDFRTQSGTGIMIAEVYGPGKIVAVWSSPDRMYALFPETGEISREFILSVADALD